jgi:hypothetical protein
MQEEKDVECDGERMAIGCLIMMLWFISLPVTAPCMWLVELYHKLKKIIKK